MALRKIKRRSTLSAAGFRFAIVCATYNPEFTEPLLEAARRELLRAGASPENLFIVRVPGSYEIPVIAARLAQSRHFDAILALGVVFEGKTSHARHILTATAVHLQKIGVQTGVPVINQVLSPAGRADARRRTGKGPFNRGVEGARTAVEMAWAMRRLKRQL